MRLICRVILVFFLIILFWEIAFRLFISSPCTQEFDSEIGYVNKPYARYVESIEGYSITRFNSIGWNDREPLWGAKVTRVLVVGDSFTEAFQVARDKGYAQIAEDYVNQQFHKEVVDLIRLGRDGFIPSHYSVVVRRYLQMFDPALILLQFSAVSGEGLYAKEAVALYDARGVVRSLQVKPKLEDRQKEQFRILVNNSSLLYYLVRKYTPVLIKAEQRLGRPSRRSDGETKIAEQRNFRKEDAARRMELVIDDIISHGKRVAILWVPVPSVYKESHQARHDETFDALERIAQERKIPIIDLSDEFIHRYRETGKMLHGFCNSLPGKGHLNAEGHAVVGKKLGSFLAKALEIK
jgi:hypothetical protein